MENESPVALMVKGALIKAQEDHESNAQNMRLGEFIKALTERPQEQTISFDFCSMTPGEFESWRGVYAELSLPPGGTYSKKKVSDVLADAKAALGKGFEGYKGGIFYMHENTPLWVSPHGEGHHTAIIGVSGNDYETIIETGWLPS